MIKEYFANYYRHRSDLTVDLSNNTICYHKNHAEPWKVTLVDTGIDALTGSRIKKVSEYIGNEPFFLTYGDGVSDINIKDLLTFHNKHGKFITLTSVQPEGRFGTLLLNENQQVLSFQEKPKGDGAWINGGFFVCQPEVLNYISDGDNVVFERDPLESMATDNQLYAYKHEGFWKPMDTQRDKMQLEDLIARETAPWIKW
jgi:glucose-1-phosphate cytidylyltransferase